MRLQIAFLSGMLFCTMTLGQNTYQRTGVGLSETYSGNSVKAAQFKSPEYFTFESLKATNGKISIAIPSHLSLEKSDATLELIKKLHETCPTCSTGGTVGGTVITGGAAPCPKPNVPSGNSSGTQSTDLTNFIQVKKSEYDVIKAKADAFDKLSTN